MADLTFGLIGASNMAMTWMLPAFQAERIALRGLYDSEPRRFGYWSDSGVEGQTTSLDELLSSEVDAVYISSRNDEHRAHVVAAAEAGKHILVEKPIALTVSDAEQMIAAARQHDVVLAVNHHLVASPLHAASRRLVADGRIGNLVGARVNHAVTLPEHLRSWRVTRAAGSGVIMDITVHDASILNPLFGGPPNDVLAFAGAQAPWNTSGALDSAMTLLRYPSSTPGRERLASTYDSFTVAGPPTQLEVFGDEGAIVITDAMTQRTDGTVQLVTGADTIPVEVDTSLSLYVILLRAFVAAIRGEGRPLTTGDEGLSALKVALAADQSAATGRVVRLADLR